jgi:hypothetical protein
MQARKTFTTLLFSLFTVAAIGAPPAKPNVCRTAVFEGELNAGQPLSQPIGGGLRVYFQALPSGWILRVLPASGPVGEHDYAELATPPYQSVTPLAISTDFAFRAQDAIGWNPRRFRFATSTAGFRDLEQAYVKYMSAGATPSDVVQAELAHQIAHTSEGTFTIVDSRLVAGTADQWRMAAAVAEHFTSTAHTLVQEPDGATSPLGRIVWLRFRLKLNIPVGFPVNPAMHLQPRPCDIP